MLWLFIDILGLETEIETMMQTLDISGSLGLLYGFLLKYSSSLYANAIYRFISDILFALYIAKRYLIHSRMDIFLTG